MTVRRVENNSTASGSEGRSTVNKELLEEAVAWAEAEASKGEMSQWDQGMWVTDGAPCGTAYCIAGHIGAMLAPEKYLTSDGFQGFHVSQFAEEALGLNLRQASALFDAANSLDDVKLVAKMILDGETFQNESWHEIRAERHRGNG